MPNDVDKHLRDILAAAEDIKEFVGTISYDDYHADKLIKAAVERKFEIIGEALNRLLRQAPQAVAKIREHEKIIAFRNVVIHGYDVVSDPLVWDVIRNKLPQLIEDANALREFEA